MHFDLAILGACAIDLEVGVSTFDIEDAQFKQVMVKQSNNVLIAVTEEKLAEFRKLELQLVFAS